MSTGVLLNPDAMPERPNLEAELIQRLAAGDDSALGELYDRLSRPLFGLALQVLRDRTEAEDVVHDVFLTLREKARSYDTSRGSVVGWAFTLTRNRAIDRVRMRRRRGELLAQADPSELGYDEAASTAPDPFLLPELASAVMSAVATLPEDQRDALHLAYFSGLTQAEIAARLSAPLGTVKARIRRGLLRLRELLPQRP
jgi:RNA polymerase sigma-70 factor, ECF subfamily